MIDQNVRVVRVHEDHILVRLGGQSGCSACDNGTGCGAGVFGKLFRRKPVLLELPKNGLTLKAGQMVVLGIPEGAYLRLVFSYYGLPLLAGLAGAIAGHTFAVWAGWGAVVRDSAALMGGVSGAWATLRSVGYWQKAGHFRNDLQQMDYRPAAVMNNCERQSTDPLA
jgi:sigma-E factor negative regulatory protein RseC